MSSHNAKRRRVVLLGATGSIGRQACDIIGRYPDHFQLVGAVAGSDAVALKAIGEQFGVTRLALASDGVDAVCEVAAFDADVVCVAIPGAAALAPTLAAIAQGRHIALATKEVLVAGGDLVRAEASRSGSTLLPVDSEHSALWQCLRGEDPGSVRRLILTASGGPFRTWTREAMTAATPKQALAHPNWDMGPKVTIDSATMMNKGLEVIEAHHLFGIPYSKIEVVVHPASIVHSMVEFVDGATIAQLGIPDMRTPIALALTGGQRLEGISTPVSITDVGSLEFHPVDDARFPAINVARDAGTRGGLAPTVLNAANEIAVQAFIAGTIAYTDIVSLVAEVVRESPSANAITLDEITAADKWARDRAAHAIALVTA